MNRKTIFGIVIIFFLGLKMIGGGVVHARDHGVSTGDCEVRECAVTASVSCLDHCLSAQMIDGGALGAASPLSFGLILFAGMVGMVFFEWRKRIQHTALAPPGLAFVRTTILRE